MTRGYDYLRPETLSPEQRRRYDYFVECIHSRLEGGRIVVLTTLRPGYLASVAGFVAR